MDMNGKENVMKKLTTYLIVVCVLGYFINASADTTATEETTPPSAEGPITPDQIPSIQSNIRPQSNMQAPPAQQNMTQPPVGAQPMQSPQSTVGTPISPQPTMMQPSMPNTPPPATVQPQVQAPPQTPQS